MKGLWLGNKKLRYRDDLPKPVPDKGEALVRVIRAGICNTDFEMIKGYYPFTGIIGHEFVGIVEHGPEALFGKRIVGEINAVCRRCTACTAGRPTHCENRTVLGILNRNGAFAEYLTLPVENLHVIPETVSDDKAVFTEPLAAALEIQEQIRIQPGDRVLVVGDGKLGQLIARTLLPTGCRLTVVGRHEGKLDLLKKSGISTEGPDGISPGTYDVSIECTGNAKGFELTRKALRPRGTLVMKSTYASDLTFDASSLVVDEITLIGSRCGPFPKALTMLADGTINLSSMIHQRFSIEQGMQAIEAAQKPGTLKVILEFQ